MAKKKKKSAKKKKKVAKTAAKSKKKVSAGMFLKQLISRNAAAKLSDRKIADKVVAAYPNRKCYSGTWFVRHSRQAMNSGKLRGFDKPKKAIPEFDTDGKIRAATRKPAKKKKVVKGRAKKKKTAKRRKKAAA